MLKYTRCYDNRALFTTQLRRVWTLDARADRNGRIIL